MTHGESIRRQTTHNGRDPEDDTSGHGATPAAPRRVELGSHEALALLATASFGRIVFTRDALPAICPVEHLVDDGLIILRIDARTTFTAQSAGSGHRGTVVAYEADQIDPDTHLGWWVVATGYAQQISDPHLIARYQRTLGARFDSATDHAVRIRPEIVTGFRLT